MYTEKELITKLQSLKEIKPRKDWAFSVKMQVLGLDTAPQPMVNKVPLYKQVTSVILNRIPHSKLAYAFAAFVFVFTGMFGFAQYTLPGDMLFSVKKITEQSQASLIGESQVKNNIETFKKRSQDLAQVVKENKEENKVAAEKEVNEAAKTLTESIVKDPAIAKEIALELKDNKTFAVLHEEGKVDQEMGVNVKEMYKTLLDIILPSQLEASLTEEQKAILEEVKALYEEEDFLGAFEKNFEINIDLHTIEVSE